MTRARLAAPRPRRATADDGAGSRSRARRLAGRQPRRHPGRLRRPVPSCGAAPVRRSRSTGTYLHVRRCGARLRRCAWPAAPATDGRRPDWSPCRCCPSTAAGRRAVPQAVRGHDRPRLAARGSPRRSRRPPTGRRSVASSARSTSANDTVTSPTSPTTGCSACAARATCCSRPRARVAAGTAGSARRCAGSTDLALDDARSGTRCASRSTWSSSSGRPGSTQLLALLPGPGRRDGVRAGPARPGPTSRRPTPCSTSRGARRRGGAAAPSRRTASPATWCRSTSATSWSAWCACVDRARRRRRGVAARSTRSSPTSTGAASYQVGEHGLREEVG